VYILNCVACYHVGFSLTDYKDFKSAQQACQQKDGKLALPKSKQSHDFIKWLIAKETGRTGTLVFESCFTAMDLIGVAVFACFKVMSMMKKFIVLKIINCFKNWKGELIKRLIGIAVHR